MTDRAAQAWFIAGTIPLIVAGALHAIEALRDVFRPRVFAPVDRAVKPAMENTGIRLRTKIRGGDTDRPSLWDAWLGFNISHGVGVFTFGLLCLLIAIQDFGLVERIDAIRPITIGFSAVYLALSLRFWFYGPALITGFATVSFTIAAVLTA